MQGFLRVIAEATLLAAALAVAVERGDEWNAARNLHARLERDLGPAAARGARVVWWEEGFFTWTGEGFTLRVVELGASVADPDSGHCPSDFEPGTIGAHPRTHLDRYFDVHLPVCRKQTLMKKGEGHGVHLVAVRGRIAVYYSG